MLNIPATSANRTTTTSGTTTSPAVAAPTGLADGEALLDVVAFNSSSLIVPTAPSGHTNVISTLGAATTRQGMVYRRNPTASEPGSVSWSHTAALVWNICQLRITGADTSSLIIDQNSATAASSTSCTAPTLTNDTVGALLLYIGIVRTTSATVTAYPSGMTVLYDQVTTASSNNTRLVVAYELLSSTGATGTRTATISTAQDNLAIAVLIRPAAVAVSSGSSVSHSGLALGIYAAPGGPLLLDATGRASTIDMSTGTHGFQSLTAALDLTPTEAFQLYDRPGLPHVVLSFGAQTVWEGRLEDVQLAFDDDTSGAVIRALGYWRATLDTPYTAVWSDSALERWRAATVEDGAVVAPVTNDRYEVDLNNRLYIGLKKSTSYSSTAPAYVLYVPPAQVVSVTFTYNLTAPSGFRARLYRTNAAMSAATAVWTVTSAGAVLTGTTTVTFTADDRLLLELVNVGAALTYPAESGTDFLRLTAVAVRGTTNAVVYADEIARALVANIGGNGGLSTSAALISSPGLDLRDEVYEDIYAGEILERLARLGDNQTPPRQWEVGVWEERRLHLRPRGSAGRTWYVDAASLTIERSLEQLTNSVYSVYQDASNRPVRSGVQADAASVARWGLTRRRALGSRTTSASQAAIERDAALQDGKDPKPRASIQIAAVYDATGATWPLWMVRAGDTIVVRSLPPALSSTIDRVRSFVVAQTQYTVDADELRLTPESPLPALESLLLFRQENDN